MVTALLTNDMNVCLVLQYAGTVAPEIPLIE